MLKDCDYVLDKQGRILIVKGYYHANPILVCPVFEPSQNGRFNPELGGYYQKIIKSHLAPELLSKKEIVRAYKPREKFASSYPELRGVWKKIADALLKAGVPFNDIGIFGSYLVGFDIEKDVDFVIYGIKNCLLLKRKMSEVFKATGTKPITRRHVAYQIKKYGGPFSKFNTFEKMLKKKWSSIQIGSVSSTIRFVYKDNEIPENPFKDAKPMREITITGEVIEDLHTNFVPRVFKIKSNGKIFNMVTYCWLYQSAVEKGDIVGIRGHLYDNDTISLTKISHGIRIIN